MAAIGGRVKTNHELIIAGGRNYKLTAEDVHFLDKLHADMQFTEIVSGACRTGVDADGELWAASRGIPIKRFPPDWDTHGLKAGPLRNTEMAAYADAACIFPGGRGSADMLRKALESMESSKSQKIRVIWQPHAHEQRIMEG